MFYYLYVYCLCCLCIVNFFKKRKCSTYNQFRILYRLYYDIFSTMSLTAALSSLLRSSVVSLPRLKLFSRIRYWFCLLADHLSICMFKLSWTVNNAFNWCWARLFPTAYNHKKKHFITIITTITVYEILYSYRLCRLFVMRFQYNKTSPFYPEFCIQFGTILNQYPF